MALIKWSGWWTDRYWMTHPAIRVDGRGSPSRLVTTSNSERATPFLGVHHQKDTILWSNKHLKLRLSSGLILSRHWLHVESTMEPSWIISETATIKHFETCPLNFWIFVVIEISVSRDTPLFLIPPQARTSGWWWCRRKASGAAAVE